MRRVGCKVGERATARGSARCREKGRGERGSNDLDRAGCTLSAADQRGGGGGLESGLDWLH